MPGSFDSAIGGLELEQASSEQRASLEIEEPGGLRRRLPPGGLDPLPLRATT